MKLIIFNIFLFIICFLNINNESFSLNESQIPNGVFNIILKKKYSSLSFSNEIVLSKDKLGSDTINVRIKLIENNLNSSIYYRIQHLSSKLFLGVKFNNYSKDDSLILTPEIIENKTLSFKFNFTKVDNNVYTIQNHNGCFLKELNQKIICVHENPNQYCHFHLLKIFSEVEINKNDEIILEKEPIDVLIKYIDLSDPNLVREGIEQIKKDEDNEELKYSIRSILKNIPWVRKIFILMPNEKVKYFKDYDLIKDKIIYVKDKDFLGHDSSNSHAFQYRFWKMKEYGISDNFIVMDDDYFIGMPLKKSDFFYVENNKVVPAIVSTIFQVHTQKTFLREYNNIKKNLKKAREQSSTTFLYTMYNTYFFFIDYFNGPIIVPYFTHNAIPSNANDLKEIYDIVYDSEYRNATLESLYRHIDTLQFQTSVNIYTFNKYSRKVNLLNYNYIDNEDTINGNFDYPLFCINTGNNKDYTKMSFPLSRLVMDKLFPEPTPYEIIDYAYMPKLSYDIMKKLEDEIKDLRNNEDKEIIIKLKNENEKKKKYVEKCDSLIEKYRKKNKEELEGGKSLKKELDNCLIKLNTIENEVKNLENKNKYPNSISTNYEDIKDELEKNIEDEKNNIIQLNMYENGINENKKKIDNLQNKHRKLYFIAILEFGILIAFIILFVLYYIFKKNNENEESSNNDIKLII